jgi:exodeoxyribonuclease VII small subunit
MAEDRDTYEATRARLEEIAVAVRKKDVSLEKSIELLEEGVRLANLCTEQIDQVELAQAVEAEGESSVAEPAGGEATARPADAAETGVEGATAVEPAPDMEGQEDDPLAEAFSEVRDDVERQAGEGQTEAFSD